MSRLIYYKYCTSRGHGQVTVTEVLLYAARQSGTVCLLAYVLLTLLRLLVDSLRLSCLTV